MPKPIVQIRNARIVQAVGELGAMRLSGELASKHPVLGEGAGKVLTSRIVEQRLSKREVETLNTIYQLVD
jgi:hypothetical protein